MMSLRCDHFWLGSDVGMTKTSSSSYPGRLWVLLSSARGSAGEGTVHSVINALN